MIKNKMVLPKEEADGRFTVYLKGGDSFDAVSSFEVEEFIGEDIFTKIVFKTYNDITEKGSIITVPAENIEYIEEQYTDDIWERLLILGGYEEDEESTEVLDVLYG